MPSPSVSSTRVPSQAGGSTAVVAKTVVVVAGTTVVVGVVVVFGAAVLVVVDGATVDGAVSAAVGVAVSPEVLHAADSTVSTTPAVRILTIAAMEDECRRRRHGLTEGGGREESCINRTPTPIEYSDRFGSRSTEGAVL